MTIKPLALLCSAVLLAPLSAADKPAWEDFVENHPGGTFFHRAAWVDVMRNGQGVLNVLPLSGVKDQVDSQIVRMEKANAPAPRVVAPLDIAL